MGNEVVMAQAMVDRKMQSIGAAIQAANLVRATWAATDGAGVKGGAGVERTDRIIATESSNKADATTVTVAGKSSQRTAHSAMSIVKSIVRASRINPIATQSSRSSATIPQKNPQDKETRISPAISTVVPQRKEGIDLPNEILNLKKTEQFFDSQSEEDGAVLRFSQSGCISTLNLERVRRLKSRLVALTRRVQKVRDEIEQLMDDDGDMAEMYFTEKKMQMESSSIYGDQSVVGYKSTDGVLSVSAPVSPVSSPPYSSRKLEKGLSIAGSRHESMRSSESAAEAQSIEELEMLLEAYFVVIDSTLNNLRSISMTQKISSTFSWTMSGTSL
ncbi:PREDICTED: magnesium transporter MRS2-B-like [Ipomoea nil]|uniref:magnesium transporter MRS2-B-like n=2 Tax=Ipomoea nil TaxID=35883 RepID=UPI0009009D72|nr:PREDICTED: magnesium transporter MRS2-B-like [Ipomoea nil]